ncbi:hypothetical protein GCM10007972_17520 [Iodidimonas muriae]|uniref:HK97 gp10 family phage protein n=1 Tax=Iodidimonas muriae TaxID=261467 RepID=A0ABQ2LFM3_9PROT|nr:hypothetical protein [Iodidimonas muriae]GER08227.1 hypothetical protein JCM17843_25370 [Kordiimonadales bacterium JCM 17843]GGO12492.1 hypothetical protein GCM10007972_17520 [Iodidimonas muriae]
MIEMRLDGKEAVERGLEKAVSRAEQALRKQLEEAANDLADLARAQILTQRQAGRVTPSVLAESLSVAPLETGFSVQASAPHAVFVELGTARMAAEPFLQPAFDEVVTGLRTALSKGDTA